MWTLGKTAALAASVRIATNQQGARPAARRRASTSRARSTSAWCSACSASRWCSAPSTGSARRRAGAARTRCRPRSGTCATRSRRPLAPPSLDTGATLRDELARLGRHYKDLPLELDWQEGVEVPERARAARPVGARRGAAQRRQARAPDQRARARGQLDGDLRARGAQRRRRRQRHARHRHGPAAGRGRGARSAARSSSSAPRTAEWRVRLVVPAATRGGERVSPERNLRVLVVDDHDVVHWGFRLLLTEQPWVERCLAAIERARRRWSWRAATSRTWRWSTCSSARSPAPSSARRSGASRRSTRVLLISGRRLDLAAGGQGRRRVGLRLQGLVGRRRGRGGAHGRARA